MKLQQGLRILPLTKWFVRVCWSRRHFEDTARARPQRTHEPCNRVGNFAFFRQGSVFCLMLFDGYIVHLERRAWGEMHDNMARAGSHATADSWRHVHVGGNLSKYRRMQEPHFGGIHKYVAIHGAREYTALKVDMLIVECRCGTGREGFRFAVRSIVRPLTSIDCKRKRGR
jgi:hypothetical protein